MRRDAWALAWALLGCAPMREGESESESEPMPEPSPPPAVVVEPDPGDPGAQTRGEGNGAAEPSPPATAEPALFEPATRGAGNCEVTVFALLDAEEYRGGGPMTPALEASLSRDPDYARMYNAESHGDHHIQCHYEIRLAHLPGQRFRWREVHGNTLRDHTAEICKQDIAAVAEHVVSSTKQCTDFAAGGYWGYVLEPFP